MAWSSRTLVVFIGLPIFSLIAATLYFYQKKEKESDELFFEREYRTIEIKIPSNCISSVIGRAGENIKSIQSKTDTKINFNQKNENQDYKTCRIRGKKEDVELAEHLILEIISSHANIITSEMEVPQKSCGRIIGRCGDNIRAISRASKCVINVDKMNDPSKPYRIVTIRGNEEQIAIAKRLIEEKVAEDEEARNKMQMTLASRSPRLSRFKKYEFAQLEEITKAPSYEKLTPAHNDTMLQVYVSAVANPTHFWLQLISPLAVELDHLVENMTEYYKKKENRDLHKLNEVSTGQIVACRVSEDNKWYRVEVCSHESYKENREETLVDVFYVDYGDSTYQKLGDLFQLRADFLSLRFQAIECSMDGIMPVSEDNQWDEATIEMFEDMVYTGQWKAISAQVVRYKPRTRSNRPEGSPVPCVKLYDPDGPPGIDIGQQLIDKGVAKAAEEKEEGDAEKDENEVKMNEDTLFKNMS